MTRATDAASWPLSSGQVTASPGERPSGVVAYGDADRAQAERHLAVLGGVPVGAHLAEHLAQLAGRPRAPARAIREGRGIRVAAPAPARGGAPRASPALSR